MDRAIILSRVSTQQQDLIQQTDEVLREVHKDGFSDDNIIIIEDKESAIKLSEEERRGLNRMKCEINEKDLAEICSRKSFFHTNLAIATVINVRKIAHSAKCLLPLCKHTLRGKCKFILAIESGKFKGRE